LPDSARRIDDLVAAAKNADAELARAREGAQWAGDSDPYRKPSEDEWDGDDDDAEDDQDDDE
jgi:ribosome-binding factor A